jgi:hypothetical protein
MTRNADLPKETPMSRAARDLRPDDVVNAKSAVATREWCDGASECWLFGLYVDHFDDPVALDHCMFLRPPSAIELADAAHELYAHLGISLAHGSWQVSATVAHAPTSAT